MKRNRKSLWVPTSILNQVLETTEYDVAYLANMMGISSAALNGYIRQGRCPRWVNVCCESVLNQGETKRTHPEFAIIQVHPTDKTLIDDLLVKMDVYVKWVEL